MTALLRFVRMISVAGRVARRTAALGIFPAFASLAIAQSSVTPKVGRRLLATRSDLEAAATAAEQLARTSKDRDVRQQKQTEASRLRLRLKDGDFQPGHRVYLSVEGDTVLTDTFTVRSDRTLLLPELPALSLGGVLDSELEPFLGKEIAKYLRNPIVHARALMQISISGAVGRPGFYPIASDLLVSDAIMAAGGPSVGAELSKVTIRRDGNDVVSAGAVQDAIRLGLTLSDVGTRPGDEIVVPVKRPSGLTRTSTVISVVSGLAVMVGILVGANR